MATEPRTGASQRCPIRQSLGFNLQPRTGASPLHLNNHELRRELMRAHDIITNVRLLTSQPDQQIVEQYNCVSADAPITDPWCCQSRLQAMHRLTPKQSYFNLGLIIFSLFLVLAWSCSQTENELLQAEAALVQSHTAQAEPYER